MSAIPHIEPVGSLGARVVYPPRHAGGEWDSRRVAFWVALVLSDGCDAAGCSVQEVLRHLGPELTRIRPDLFPPVPRRGAADDSPEEPATRTPWWRRKVLDEPVLSWLGVAATAVLLAVIVAGGLLGWWG